MEASRVYRRNGAHADDQHLGFPGDLIERVLELLRGAKEERTVDLEDLNTVRHAPIADCVRITLVISVFIRQLARDNADVGDLGHATHEKEGGEDHSYFDRDRKIDDDRKSERREQDDHVALRSRQLPAKRPPLTHVVGNHYQNRRQSREGDESRPSAEEQSNEQQRQSVNHPRDRSTTTVLDVRRRPRDSTGCRNAAKQRRDDVRDSLCDELHVRSMPPTDHSIGNDS